MTISELRLALDLSFDHKANVLKQHTRQMFNGSYLFVDSVDGSCYLFDKDGNEDDISKLTHIESDFLVEDSCLKLVKIPASVTSIGDWAFAWCRSLKSVTIPDSVASIGVWGFESCISLTNVTLGNGVTSIGDAAFSGCCSLTNVVIPSGVTSIGSSTFSGCRGLTSVTIPNNVTSIGRLAFFDCKGLTSMTIPSSVINIEDGVFYGCTNLKELIFKGKSIAEVKAMKYYPWGIRDKSVIRCES